MEQIAIIYPGRPEIAENVRRLATPDGFERVDITIPARGNRAAAYQRAMASSSARYKVYIDEGSVSGAGAGIGALMSCEA